MAAPQGAAATSGPHPAPSHMVSPAAAAGSQPQILLPSASPYLPWQRDPLSLLPSAQEPAGLGGTGKWSQRSALLSLCWQEAQAGLQRAGSMGWSCWLNAICHL